MQKIKFISFLLLFFSSALSAQAPGSLSLDVRVGIGSYTTYDDFQKIVYTIEGQGYNSSEGNVAESDLQPNLYLGINYQLADRVQLAPFANYLFGSGEHYKNDILRFGISDINPEVQIFSAPAEYKIKALTVGTEVRYKLFDVVSDQIYIGTGLAYTIRSHYYRNEMDVDFGSDRIAQQVDERFTTANKSGITIPLMLGIERPINDRLTLTVDVRGLILTNSEDGAWNAGVGLRWSL
jgi:hypothetical protein